MKYIIFGAGCSGDWAFRYFGRNRIHCFADNWKAGTIKRYKAVISYEEMLALYRSDEGMIIVIASENYWEEMEQQIKKDNIVRYFVFHEADIYFMMRVLPYYYLYKRPVHLSYTQILANYNLLSYRKIAVYGVNRFSPYLITEIMDRNPEADITVIPQNNDSEEYNILGLKKSDFVSGINKADLLIIAIGRYEDNIRDKLEEMEGKDFDVADLFEIDDFEPRFQHRELAVYKDTHKGKRMFIIGTGPSLQIEDLNTLHKYGELCIACNKIYRVYDRTPWRADYYGFLDGKVIEDCREDIPDIPGTVFCGDSYHYDINTYDPNAVYFHYKEQGFYPNHPGFSDDFTKGFYTGSTTTYSFGIQLAAYMGAKEIILLGVDHNISGNITDPGNHFFQDYYRNDEALKYRNLTFQKEVLTKAYEWAEIYSRRHGFRIYNATRGGNLEVFERIDFDSLFE